MALVLKDRVKETSTTVGTGTLTLAGAVAGFQSFAAVGNGNTTYYAIADSITGDWEVGIGTYTSSGTTLSRTTVLSSSNGGSLVNFAANPKDVFVTYPSEKSVYEDASNVVNATSFGAITATSAALTTGTITTAPVNNTDIVNKQYADAIASGIHFHEAVNLATTAALPANTYNNGTSGVGATLTANANGALSVDSTLTTASERILVKNEAAGANNGVYTVTQVGSAGTPYILTRATDFDSVGTGVDQIDEGDFFLVTSGTANVNTAWVQQTPPPITIGTTALVFQQFSAPITYTAGTGLSESPTYTFNIANTTVTAATYGSASQVPVFAVNAQGQLTSVTNTAIAINGSAVTGNISGSAGSVANALTLGTYLTGTSYNGSSAVTAAVDATSVNTASKVVARDASGNFAAGTITAALSGNASTATAATNISGGAANQIPYNTALATTSFITAPTTAGTYLNWTGSAFAYTAISTPSSVTFNNGGAGDASGTSFNGSTARTISYNTVGAPSTGGTGATGTWGISISGNAATATSATSATSATTATNLAGGSAGTVPYQSAAGTTVQLAAGTSGFVLKSNGAAAPSWTAATISGVQLGSNLATLTMGVSGTGLSGSTTYNGSGAATFTVTSNATNANTASTIVARDASGNFSAGTITAALNGNATTATTAANVNNGTLTMNVSGTGLSGSQTFTANQSTAATFTVTSNATNANTASTIVARDASGNFSAGTITAALTGNVTGNVTGSSGSTTGNAATATTLQTARTINGVSFNGSANITVTASTTNTLTLGSYLTGTSFNGSAAVTAAVDATTAATASKVVARDASGYVFAAYYNAVGTFPVTASANTSGMATFTGTNGSDNYGRGYTAAAAAALLSGQTMNIVGSATSATTATNLAGGATGSIAYQSGAGATTFLADVATGNAVISGGVGVAPSYGKIGLTTHVSGTLPVANGGTGVTTSTGSGDNVLSTSPTLVTPVLGTPSSGTLSNCTVDGTNKVGYLNIPQNAQTGSYTLVLADAGKHIYHATGAGAATYTIPANASVAYPIGTAVSFINLSTTAVSIAITSDTMYLSSTGTTGTRTLANYGTATAVKITSTAWIITGSGLT